MLRPCAAPTDRTASALSRPTKLRRKAPTAHVAPFERVGHQLHDSFAEALDDVVVCVMTKADVLITLGRGRITILARDKLRQIAAG
jgi:hypothetical protein